MNDEVELLDAENLELSKGLTGGAVATQDSKVS